MANTPSKRGVSVGTQKRQVAFNKDLFIAGVTGTLKSQDRGITDETPDNIVQTAIDEVLELFEIANEGKKVQELYDNAVSALEGFDAWLTTIDYKYEEPVYFNVTGFSVSVSVPTKVPNSMATFQIHGTNSEGVDVEVAIKHAYDYLSGIVRTNYRVAPQQNTPVPQQQSNLKPQDDTQIFFNTLRVEKFKDNLVFRLIPADSRWSQHGVAVYGDEARKAGIDLKDYSELGDYEISGTGDIEYKPDGKPMRWKNINTD